MIKLFYIRLIILSLSISATISIKAQFGYSPAIDSMVNLVTLESLTLLDRQLSGDTTVIINGNVDSIMSRYSNSIYNPKAAQFILEKFQSFGLFARFQNYDANGQNVIAIKNGIIFPDKEFIVCAHYDDVPSSGLAPGADDNASGVCGVIEAARIFSGFEFPYTLKFIAFDEEEQGLIGSAAYADSAFLNGDDILGVINLDMIAWDANGDFQNSVASNDNSMPLFAKFIDILKTYQPQLSPHLFYTTASDHYRFWGKSYKALLNIEDWQDFNAYYHTIRDSIPNIDMPFFLTMTRGSLAALASLALDYKAEIIHSPLSSLNNTLSRVATINLTSPYTLGSGINAPRLYYKADEGEADFVNPFYSNLDTVKFMIPGQPPGSKVSYYFAVQDAGGNYIRTLPAGGRGIDPPGEQAPPEYFSFYVLNDTTELFCMTGLPQSLPVNNNIKLFTLNISKAGEIHDINVKISVTHTNSWDLDLYLVAPDGREVELSTKNGYNYDHYTNTVFDDEASTWIHQNKPPFTGSFKPEKPLAMLDDTTLNGNWKLKIRNRGSTAGQLTVFCMEVRYSRNNYYVDGNKTVSGNGRSWSTAFRTITEATIMNPSPGTTVFIKPATYNESVRITSNGTERISLTTGISLSNGNKVQFPTGTNLSGISLSSFPGEYYAYIFRSRLANNGVYRIIEVNDAADFIRVEGADFIDESGIASDSTALLGSAGRPVIYKKYTTDPLNERVILDANQVPVINSILYIGDSICDGSSDALPANYNIIDGIDLTNSGNCGGIHLQSSSFNYICNSRIYQTNGTGIYINGNQDHPALFNIIKDNFICNTPLHGLMIGMEGAPFYNNQARFTHLLYNEIYTSGTGQMAKFDNAIKIRSYNDGSIIQGNIIRDFDIEDEGSGALEIGPITDHTLVYGNVFSDIGENNAGENSIIHLDSNIYKVEIFNNVIYDSVSSDNDIYSFRIDGTGHDSSRVVHNTIYNIDRGLILEDYMNDPIFEIRNNIFYVNDTCYMNRGNQGRFEISNNLFFSDPAPLAGMPYHDSPGQQIGEVHFADPAQGDFNLTILGDLAICNGAPLDPQVITDILGRERYQDAPDIGAFELESKNAWEGTISNNWSEPLNWSRQIVPDSTMNIVIRNISPMPVIQPGNAVCKGLLLKDGSVLNLQSGVTLEIRHE